ncbi:hypothetical protein TEK04_07440 [Klenkia sp. LSe6-5]|uniref:Fibronectin type-III domain-containing protein n=1 Tax=Klenkia sesuvii TaxID=3103137 RepID=A0ABU8DRX2_9ACTN
MWPITFPMMVRRRAAGWAAPRRWAPALRGLLGAAVLGGVLLAGGPAQQADEDGPALVEVSDSNPLPPTGVVITAGNGQFTSVRWTASTEPNASGYVVRVGSYQTTVSGTSTTTPITGLVNGTDYTVQVFTRTNYNLLGLQTATGTVPATATSYPRDGVEPARPTGVTAVRGDGQVTVSWAANTEPDLAGYRVLRDGTPVSGTLTGRSYVDTGLVNDTTYRYSVQAVDVSRQWSASSVPAVAATPTDLTAPGTPRMLLAERGDRQVTLSWAANPEPDVASYRLLRDGVEVASIPAGSHGYTDTGLDNDRTYRYTLVAVDTHANRSAPTAGIDATPTDLTPPAVPTGLAATRGDTRVTLAWAANAEPDLGSYRLLRDGVQIAEVSRTTLTYTDSGLTNDTTYRYALVAVDTHLNPSAPTAAVPATPTDLTPPAAPTGVTAVRGDGVVQLSWAANGEADLAGYVVLRDGVQVSGLVTGTGWTDTGLTNDTPYRYVVVAVDTHGNRSAPSAPVEASPADFTAPAAPTGFTAVRGDSQVELSWAANGEPDLDAYRLFRDGVLVATVRGTSFRDTGLVNDTAYRYLLVAVDAAGNASPGVGASATPTDLTAPAAPTAPAATAGERAASVTWTPSPDPDVVGHRVLVDGVEAAAVTGPPAVVGGLAPGTTVTVTVVAVDGHGNVSAPSAAVTVTPYDRTAPGAPTGVTATPGPGSTTVAWTSPADPDPLTFRVLRDGVLVATVAAAPVTVTGLAEGSTVSITVVAVDPSGNASPPSAAVPAAPLTAAVPAQGSGQTGGLAVSGDGRFVVVGTRARLEASDTNSAYELYRLDRVAGSATRIAPLGAGATGPDATNSAAPAVSDDGRYVVLATTAALVPADTNRLADVYRLDTVTGAWALVSVPADGRVSPTVAGTELQTATTVTATSPAVATSGDGDLVLFYSARADLGPVDTNGVVDLYAKRMSTGAVTRVSAAPGGGDLPRAATGPALALTPDGRYALFPATGPAGPMVLYRATLSGADAGRTVVVSTMTAGGRTTEVGVLRDAGDVDLSDDGRYVVFSTSARPTSPGQSFSTALAYRADTTTGAVQALGTGQTIHQEHKVALDPTGRYGFVATAAPLLAGDVDGHTDVFRRDLDTGVLVLVTADSSGRQTAGPGGSVSPAEHPRVVPVTGDLVVLLTSEALVPGDTNRVRDLYVKDLVSGAVLSPVS